MDVGAAVEILRMLQEGIDPLTGEVLPTDHLICEPMVRQALICAVGRMEALDGSADAQLNRSGRLNAGRPWTKEDLADLRTLYESGVSIEEIARLTHRRPRGIRLQLNLMAGGSARRDGRVFIPDRLAPGEEGLLKLEPSRVPDRPSNGYQPWSAELDARLEMLHASGRSVSEMARMFERTSGAIASRLKKLGLVDLPQQKPQTSPQMDGASAVSASRRWTREEDAYLREAWHSGTPTEKMAAVLGRRDRLIRCRLVYLDLADHGILGGEIVPPELAHQGLPWYPEEIETMQRMLESGCSLREIAAVLRRSADVVNNRMVMLGLRDDAPDDAQ